MCDALVELMEDYVEEQVEERVERRLKEQAEERIEQRVKERMETERDRLKNEYSKEINDQREAGMKTLICSLQNLGIPRKETVRQLAEQYSLADESAERYVEKYWRK